MKNSRIGIWILVIFGLAGWLLAAREPLLAALKSLPLSGLHTTEEPKVVATMGKVITPLEADFRDPKLRAAQEAAFSRKYHPQAQGAVMDYPEKAIKVAEEPKKAEAVLPVAPVPEETQEGRKMTRDEWNQSMDKFYRAVAKHEPSSDVKPEAEVSFEKSDTWLAGIKDAPNMDSDSSWQKVGSKGTW